MAPHLHDPKSFSKTEKDLHERVHRNATQAAALRLPMGASMTEKIDSSFRRNAYKVLHKPYFDYIMGLVILVNFVLVIVETDLLAKQHALPSWIPIADWFVRAIFVAELAMRLFVLRRKFFLESWNDFDFVIVTIDALMSVMGLVFGSMFPVSALRILRLCKLARVSKVFRVFPELREMMAGLVGSLRAIFWGSFVLIFGLLVCGVVAVQFIHPINQRVTDSGHYQDIGCDRCPNAFSSVFDATLTFYQQIVAGDSWGQVTIPIIYESYLSLVFFAFVFVAIGMALLNLILGVVVNVATQAHDSLASEIEDEKLVKRMEVHGHLMTICEEMDEDDSGELTQEEVFNGFKKNKGFQKTLADMDIAEDDLQILWTVLDQDRTGKVRCEDFVSHCYRMKLSDTQFMLAYIKFYITVIKDKICGDMQGMQDTLAAGQHQLEAEMEKIEAEELNLEAEVQCRQESGQIVLQEVKETAAAEQIAVNAGKLVDGKQNEKKNPSVMSELLATPTSSSPALENSTIEVDSQLYRSIVEESRQQRADLLSRIDEIKSRLDICLPVLPAMEPKLKSTALPALPNIPQERWPLSCCRGSPPPVMVSMLQEETNWPGNLQNSFTVNNWPGNPQNSFTVNDQPGSGV